MGGFVGGNSDIYMDQVFYFKPLEMAFNIVSYGWIGMYVENAEPLWNFYINDISDRYYIMGNLIGGGRNSTNFEAGYNANKYVFKCPILKGVSSSHELINAPQEYVLHSESFKHSVLGLDNPNIFPAFTTISVLNGKQVYNRQLWTEESDFNPIEDEVKLYLNNPMKQDDPYNVLAAGGIVDNFQYINPFATIPTYIKGNFIVMTENGELQYGAGHSGHSIYFFGEFNTPLEGGEGLLPFHPKFSYFLEQNQSSIQGNNTPISRTSFYNGLFKLQYKGRYGEVRETDLFNTQFDIQQDGSSIYSGDILGFSLIPFPTVGEVSMTLSNTNVVVDDIAGKNITKLFFDYTNEDSMPPTLQHLQFRNTDGKVTDRFTSASEGTVRLAAGDFKFIESHYDYNPGNTVEFSYSQYDQNNWTELPLTNYPEHFQMPAFGDYYEASLADVVVPEDNTWFDVKIICTDAAGNKQEQIISPAFKIAEKTLAAADVRKSDLSVYPNPFTDELNIQLPENIKGNVTFKVTDMAGKRFIPKTAGMRNHLFSTVLLYQKAFT